MGVLASAKPLLEYVNEVKRHLVLIGKPVPLPADRGTIIRYPDHERPALTIEETGDTLQRGSSPYAGLFRRYEDWCEASI